MSASITHLADPHDDLTRMLDTYDWHMLRAGQVQHGDVAIVASRRPTDRERQPEPELMAADVIAELKKHCTATGEPQRYHVVLLEEDRSVMAQTLVTLHPVTALQTTSTTSPAATFRAAMLSDDPEVLSLAIRQSEQAMHHNENAWRMLGQSYKATLGMLGAQLERANRRCEELEAKQLESAKLREEMLSKKAERELAAKQAEQKSRLWEAGLQRVSEMAPFAISQLTGASKVAEFIDSFPPEQLQTVMAALGPEQRARLDEILAVAKRGKLAQQVIAGSPSVMASGPLDGVAQAPFAARDSASPSGDGATGDDTVKRLDAFMKLLDDLTEEQFQMLRKTATPEQEEVWRFIDGASPAEKGGAS